MWGRILTSLILLTTSLLSAQGLTGILTTTEGDIDKPARVIAKRGDLIAMDSTFLLGETYTADWSTVGVDKFDYRLPQPKLLGLANSVSSDGNIYPIVSGDVDQLTYRVYDIQGREVQSKSSIPAGKYFLQLMNKSSGDLLGVQSFVLLNHQLNVQFKNSMSNTRMGKPAEDVDSLIVIYEADDMELEPYREAVVLPASGYTQLDIELVRNRRGPSLNFYNVPESPTIDTTYVIMISATCPDYDDHITEVDVFHLSGDTIQWEFNDVDSLLISPHTQGEHEFHVLATGEYSHRGRNIELSVESQTYSVILTKLFNGLGLPRVDIDVTLRDKIIRTGTDGLAAFEFPTWTVLTETDSIDLDDNILGHLQDGTGPFAAMRICIDPSLINSGIAQVIQTFTDAMMQEDPGYWDNYVWENQLDREFYLMSMHLALNNDFTIPKWGTPETGFTDMLHYSPEHVYNGSQGPLDYRAETQIVIDTIATRITEIAGEGQIPKTMIVVAPEDSMLAINNGNVFDFTEDHSQLMYVEFAAQDGLGYILRAGEHVDYSVSNPVELRRIMAHELGRGVNYGVLTPYQEGAIPDIMRNGQMQPHDFYGFYFVLNVDPKLFNHIEDIRAITPTSPSY